MSATKPRRRELPELTPEMALEMLSSAINYCQNAGLTARAVNTTSGMLAILVEGARVEGDRLVMSADMPALTPGPSPVADDRRGE